MEGGVFSSPPAVGSSLPFFDCIHYLRPRGEVPRTIILLFASFFFYFYPISIGTLRSRGTTFVYDRKDFARSILTPCFSPALATATSFLFGAHTHTHRFHRLPGFYAQFVSFSWAQRSYSRSRVAPVFRPLCQTFATGPHWLETEVDDLG